MGERSVPAKPNESNAGGLRSRLKAVARLSRHLRALSFGEDTTRKVIHKSQQADFLSFEAAQKQRTLRTSLKTPSPCKSQVWKALDGWYVILGFPQTKCVIDNIELSGQITNTGHRQTKLPVQQGNPKHPKNTPKRIQQLEMNKTTITCLRRPKTLPPPKALQSARIYLQNEHDMDHRP